MLFRSYHKADRYWRGSDVVISAALSPAAFNCVDLLSLYLARRDALHGPSGALFLREDGRPVTRGWFLPRLETFAPEITGHGLRAGGATFLAGLGVDAATIKRLGRWSSDAWEIYIRDHPSVNAALQARAARAPAPPGRRR